MFHGCETVFLLGFSFILHTEKDGLQPELGTCHKIPGMAYIVVKASNKAV